MAKRDASDLLVSPGCEDPALKKTDTKPSPVKDTTDPDEQAEIIANIQDSAPAWFSNAFSYILKEFSALKVKNNAINVVKAELTNEINQLQKRVVELENQNRQQCESINLLQDKVHHLESYSRRENLLFDGIPETPNEDLLSKVTQFIGQTLKVPGTIQLSRIHRLGKPHQLTPDSATRPRTVIARFHFCPDRDKVWKASWSLKNSKIKVSEDFPENVLCNRRLLLPVLRAAKQHSAFKRKKCFLRGDRLHIDGAVYTVSTLDNIPTKLQWAVKGERYISKTDSTYFFGRQCFLSNFHPAPFIDNGIRYSCSEQYYLSQKSLFFNDETTAGAIMRSKDPAQMKSMSRRIKGLDEAKWNQRARACMERGCMLKFSQNEQLLEKLLETKGNLVEANKHDSFFSCGLALGDPNISEQSRWTGQNVLGSILMALRVNLSDIK